MDWISLTVPSGRYTLVVRVNWNQLPDALGRVEKDFDRNWAQVCFNLVKDPLPGGPQPFVLLWIELPTAGGLQRRRIWRSSFGLCLVFATELRCVATSTTIRLSKCWTERRT